MYLKVPNKYKETVVSIQKIKVDPFDDEQGYVYELNLKDGYGLYGSEDDAGMIYFESYKEMRNEMKYIRKIKQRKE